MSPAAPSFTSGTFPVLKFGIFCYRIRAAALHDFHRIDLEHCRERPPSADMWVDWSAEVQGTDEATRAIEPPAPLAETEVTFRLSDAGPLAPHQDWKVWDLGVRQFEAVTTTTAEVYAEAERLAAPVAAGRGFTLILDFPRILPRSDRLTLRELGVGGKVEAQCRLVPPAAEEEAKL